MSKRILFLFVLYFNSFFSISSEVMAATPKSKSNGKILIVHLGLIHNMHLDEGFHYPPSTLIDVINKVKPDLICGEAVTDQWQKGLAGLYPYENRILEFAGKKYGAQFIPVDWRSSYPEVKELFEVEKKYLTADQNSKATAERLKIDNEFEMTLTKEKGSRFFNYLHTKFIADSAQYHTYSERFYGDIPNGFWYRRNTNIAVNCYEAARRLGAHKVLLAYGAEHQYILDSLLKFFPEVKSVGLGEVLNLSAINIKSRKLPPELKDVFERDLSSLRAYVKSLQDNSDEKKELGEKRLPGLEKIIEALFH